MSFEKNNFDHSDQGFRPDKPQQAEREFIETHSDSQRKNHFHDLLWDIIIDKRIGNVLDIPVEQLPELYVAAEMFSLPANFKELTDGEEAWQVARAEKMINQLLRDAEIADKKASAA